MKIIQIALTGGPGGGKTQSLSQLGILLEEEGYKVFKVPEVATVLITGGINFSKLSSSQKIETYLSLSLLIISLEKAFITAAHSLNHPNNIIICDRGLLDQKAYLTIDEWEEVKSRLEICEKNLCERYDGVFHLITAAEGNGEFYTTLNNIARSETREEALALDKLTAMAWEKHANRKFIHNEKTFEEKVIKLKAEIISLLKSK